MPLPQYYLLVKLQSIFFLTWSGCFQKTLENLGPKSMTMTHTLSFLIHYTNVGGGKKSLSTVVFSFLIASVLSTLGLPAQTHINKYTLSSFGSPFSQIEWSSTTKDAYGNLIFTGNSVISSTQVAILTAKFSPTGDSIWQKTWLAANDSNPSASFGIATTTDASGNVYIAGAAAIGLNPGQNQFDYIILKYNSSGNLLWATSYDGTAGDADIPSALITDGSGNLFVTGISAGVNSGFDYLTLKLATSNGNILWQKRYDEAGFDDFAVAIELDSSGNPVVAGASGPDSLQQAVTTLKYQASDGALQAEDQFQETGADFKMAKAFTKDADGNFYLALNSNPTDTNQNIQILKLDDGLNQLWSYTYDNIGKEDGANAISRGAGGQIFVTGYSQNNYDQYELLVFSLKPDSTFLWEKHFRPATAQENIVGKKSVMSLDSNLYVSGDLIYPDSTSVLTLKFDIDGNILWQNKFSGGEKVNKAMNIETGLDKNLFVFGVTGSSEKSSYFRIRYKEFEREGGVETDTVTGAKYRPAELIVKFDGDALIHDRVNQLDITHEHPSWFLTQAAYDTLALRVSLERATLVRIFRELKTTHTSTVSRRGETVLMRDFWAAFILVFPTNEDLETAIQILESTSPLVEYAHPNFLVELAYVPNEMEMVCEPNDTYYELQHSLHETGQFTTDVDINIEPVWCDFEVYGDPSIKVGIFDTGIDWEHVDFGSAQPGASVVKGGYEFVTDLDLLSHPNPDFSNVSHGTSIAGIVGAVRDNEWGVAGIAGGDGNSETGGNGVSLYGLKLYYTNSHPNNEVAEVAEGIVYSFMEEGTTPKSYGLHIHQHAWISSPNNSEETMQLLSDAIRNANRAQVITVSARGNTADMSPSYPGTYDDDWVINVSTSGVNGDFAEGEWSVGGPAYGLNVDLIAPGTEGLVYSLRKNQLYDYTPDGTSYASPHVAGVAALMLTYHNLTAPNQYEFLAPEDVEFVLENTAKDVGPPDWDEKNANGRLDAGAAFELIRKPDRLIKHFGTSSYSSSLSSSLIDSDVIIKFIEPFFNGLVTFQKNTEYKTNIYKYTAVVSHNLDPIWTIEEKWSRHSSSNTFPYFSADILPHEKVNLVSVNQNTATLEGYLYEIKDILTGDLVGWAPVSPSDLRMEYSLLLSKEPTTAVVDQPRSTVLEIYPNPASQDATLRINNAGQSEINARLYSATGTFIQSIYSGFVETDSFEFRFDLADLPPGYYLINVMTELGVIAKPIVIF